MRLAKNNFVALSCIILISFTINAGATSHRYDTGILTAVTDSQINMSGRLYFLSPMTKVIFKERGPKGAYYEHERRLSHLRIGEKIQLKVIGNKIIQVEVVR